MPQTQGNGVSMLAEDARERLLGYILEWIAVKGQSVLRPNAVRALAALLRNGCTVPKPSLGPLYMYCTRGLDQQKPAWVVLLAVMVVQKLLTAGMRKKYLGMLPSLRVVYTDRGTVVQLVRVGVDEPLSAVMASPPPPAGCERLFLLETLRFVIEATPVVERSATLECIDAVNQADEVALNKELVDMFPLDAVQTATTVLTNTSLLGLDSALALLPAAMYDVMRVLHVQRRLVTVAEVKTTPAGSPTGPDSSSDVVLSASQGEARPAALTVSNALHALEKVTKMAAAPESEAVFTAVAAALRWAGRQEGYVMQRQKHKSAHAHLHKVLLGEAQPHGQH